MDGMEKIIAQLLKGKIDDIISPEDLLLEVGKDIVKETIKNNIKQKLDEDPELRNELKSAINLYFEAKIKEISATLKIAKCGAKLGLAIMPKNLKDEITRDILGLVEKEIDEIMEKTL
ncbi:MAG: hypothetical protein AB1779_07945 [Candidatus Thermoplasmatota archaeon]